MLLFMDSLYIQVASEHSWYVRHLCASGSFTTSASCHLETHTWARLWLQLVLLELTLALLIVLLV